MLPLLIFVINQKGKAYSAETPEDPGGSCISPTFSGIFTHPDCAGNGGVAGARVRVENGNDPSLKASTTTNQNGEFSLTVTCNQGEIASPLDPSYRRFLIIVDYTDTAGLVCGGAFNDTVIFDTTDIRRQKSYDNNISKCNPGDVLSCSATSSNQCAPIRFVGLVKSRYFPAGVPYTKAVFINADDATVGGYYVTGTDGTYNLPVSPHPKEFDSENSIYRTFNFFAEYTYNNGTKCTSPQRTVTVVRPYQQCIYEAIQDVGDIDLGECGPKTSADFPTTLPPTGPGTGPLPTPSPLLLPITGSLVCREGITGLSGGNWDSGFFSQRTIGYFKDLGVTYTRITARWDNAESWPNYPNGSPVFNFTDGDREITAMRQSGVKDAITLFVGPQWWYADGNPDTCSGMSGSDFSDVSSFCICYRAQECKPGGRGIGKWCGTSAQREENARNPALYCGISKSKEGLYRESIKKIVGHYYNKFGLTLWEFWNEPEMYRNGMEDPENYAWALKVFYEEAKKFSGVKVAFNANWGKYGGSLDPNSYDAAVIHPYPSQPATEAIDKGKIEELRNGLASAGRSDAKIWITEWGYEMLRSECDLPSTSESDQLRLYKEARDWLNMQSDIEYAIFFILDDKPKVSSSHPYGPGDNVCWGMIKEDFWNPNATPTKRPIYDVFKDKKSCTYTVSAGTCEEPLKYTSAPSCENLTITAPETGKQELSGGCTDVSATIIPDWRCEWKMKYTRNWSDVNGLGQKSRYKLTAPDFSEYFFWSRAQETERKPVLVELTGEPAMGNEKFVTAIQSGNPKQNKYGLFSYFSSPERTTTYYSDKFQDLQNQATGYKDRAAAVLLSKDSIALLGGSAGGVSLIPVTQTTLGGARLEKKEVALGGYAAMASLCAIAGRVGDTDCGPRSGITNFNLFAAAVQNDFGNYTGDQLAVYPESLVNNTMACAGPTPNIKSNGQLLASAIPVSTASSIDTLDTPSYSAESLPGQVLGAIPCYSTSSTSKNLECPSSGSKATTVEKDIIDIKGISTKEETCTKNGSGLYAPSSGSCSTTFTINAQQKTIYSFEYLIQNLIMKTASSIATSPSVQVAKVLDYTDRKHNEIPAGGGINVDSTKVGFVVDGVKTKCLWEILTASINNSPAHKYDQPDPNCFETTNPPDSVATSCNMFGLWTNANTVSWDDQSKPEDPSFGLPESSLIKLTFMLIARDAETFTATGNACTGCPYNSEGPRSGISVKYQGNTKTMVWKTIGKAHTLIGNLRIPIGAKYEIFSGVGGNIGESSPCYNRVTLVKRDATADICLQSYVYPIVHGSTTGEEYQKTNNSCGNTNTCFVGRPCSATTPDGNTPSGCDDGNSEAGLQDSGHYWASIFGRPIGALPCNFGFDDISKQINLAEVIFEDVACKSGGCIAVGRNNGAMWTDGFVARSSNDGNAWNVSFRKDKAGIYEGMFHVSLLSGMEAFIGGQSGQILYGQDWKNPSVKFLSQPTGKQSYILGLGIKQVGTDVLGFAGLSGLEVLKKSTGANPTWEGFTVPVSAFRTVDDFAFSSTGSRVIATQAGGGQDYWIGSTTDTSGWELKGGFPGTCSAQGVGKLRVRALDDNLTNFVVATGKEKELGGKFGCLVKCTGAVAPICTNKAVSDSAMFGLDFGPDKKTGVAVGLGGMIQITRDGGETWELSNSGTTEDLRGVSMINDFAAVAVGDKGTILRSENIQSATPTWEKKNLIQNDYFGEDW